MSIASLDCPYAAQGRYRRAAMGDAADLDDARRPRGPEQWQQPAGQGEVAEVVGAELQLEAIRGGVPAGRRHHPGIVHQQVEAAMLGRHPLGEGRDRGEAGEIEFGEADIGLRHLRPDARDRGGAAVRVAAGKDDLGLGPRQGESGFEPQSAGAGDDRRAAGLGGDVGDRPRRHDACILCCAHHMGTIGR
jgi:hypothetical protein